MKVEVRDVSDFNSIEVSNGLHVYITFGNAQSLEIEADENLHDVIRTEVTGGVLKVYSEMNIRNSKAKNIRVTVPELEEIEASAAASVRCENTLKTNMLSISVSSAADVKVEVKAKEIEMDASSSGSIDIRGEADDLDVNVSSAGSIDAYDLTVKNCRVSASSAGSSKLRVTEELSAEASSAGSIHYKGEPRIVKLDSSSGGSIKGHDISSN